MPHVASGGNKEPVRIRNSKMVVAGFINKNI
jgi:hypothetical protein